MAVIEKDGLYQYIDKDGNIYILYPVTKLDNVSGTGKLVHLKDGTTLQTLDGTNIALVTEEDLEALANTANAATRVEYVDNVLKTLGGTEIPLGGDTMTILDNRCIQFVNESKNWVAPKAVNQKFKVIAVGGGGGYGASYDTGASTYRHGGGGGGSGYIEFAVLTIPEGENVPIICGAGGIVSTDGGATSFGDYLIAEGGKRGGDATSTVAGDGGDGEAGGGGGSVDGLSSVYENVKSGKGGNGRIYGGGGGGGGSYYGGTAGVGGTGGIYGGGGGGGYRKWKQTTAAGGTGGIYGGNGGTAGATAEGGTTIDVFKYGAYALDMLHDVLDFDIEMIYSGGAVGTSTNKSGHGGGGYGSVGGTAHYTSNNSMAVAGGGGGGYFGRGGSVAAYDTSTAMSRRGGGGGGGYFALGGSPSSNGGGGGGGFFHVPINGNGGGFISSSNGGVLIMYIAETEEA